MAEFLTTKEITERIATVIIGNAEKKIVLVSPYFKLDTGIVESLSEAMKENKNLEVTMIYGKTNLPDAEKKKLEGMNIKVLFRKNLHAKCYLNEGAAIVTSMNLHEYSQTKNDEFGIFISKMSKDKEAYEKIDKEVQKIIENSEEKDLVKKGHCIRCGKEIELNPKHPYCKSCYSTWAKYKDPDYEEKYCHMCGKKVKTSMNKPLCKSCWSKYNKA